LSRAICQYFGSERGTQVISPENFDSSAVDERYDH
jgi:hypothetical protein